MKTRCPCEFAVFAQMNDLLDEALAFVVARMGLAGEDELDRAAACRGELHDVLELLENQRRAFVGGEAAGEADGQRVGIQQVVEADEVALGERAGFGSAGGGGRIRSVRGAACSAAPRVPRRRRTSGRSSFPRTQAWLTAEAQSVPNFSRKNGRAALSSPSVSLFRQNWRTVPFIQPSR